MNEIMHTHERITCYHWKWSDIFDIHKKIQNGLFVASSFTNLMFSMIQHGCDLLEMTIQFSGRWAQNIRRTKFISDMAHITICKMKWNVSKTFLRKLKFLLLVFVPLITFNIRSILYPLYHYIRDMPFLLISIKYPIKMYLKGRWFMVY